MDRSEKLWKTQEKSEISARFFRKISTISAVPGIDFLDCMFLINCQSLCQPSILLWCQLLQLRLRSRPLKAAGLQSFIAQEKTITLPEKCLDPIRPSPAKQEQAVLVRIQFKPVLNNGNQAIDTAAQISVANCNIDVVNPGDVVKHGVPSQCSRSDRPKPDYSGRSSGLYNEALLYCLNFQGSYR